MAGVRSAVEFSPTDPRLPARITSRLRVDPATGCWLWTGFVQKLTGYAQIRMGNGYRPCAHRAVYTLLAGAIPAGLTLDHLCRVRHCVNPAHLEPVTAKENCLRGVSPFAKNARKSCCPRCSGPLTIRSDGARHCLACKAMNAKARYAKFLLLDVDVRRKKWRDEANARNHRKRSERPSGRERATEDI